MAINKERIAVPNERDGTGSVARRLCDGRGRHAWHPSNLVILEDILRGGPQRVSHPSDPPFCLCLPTMSSRPFVLSVVWFSLTLTHAAVFAQDSGSDPRTLEWAWTPDEASLAGEGFWPQYRGPRGDGVAAKNANPPLKWSESENVKWRTDITGKAWSSPIVWGDRIWLTNATNDGLSMSVLAVDRETGKIEIDRVVFTNETTQKDYHEFNSYASPTPICDSKHVYVSFGAYGTAALDARDGKTVWERRDLPCNHYRGAGASPILFRDLLIFSMDGFDYQYLVALNKQTGKTVWKVDRNIDYGTNDGDWKKSYGTPHVIRVDDQLQLISPAAKAVIAYDPTTGNELWRVRYEEHSNAGRPLFDGKHVLMSSGFSKAKMLAIDPSGRGDLTSTHVRWQATRAIGCKPSPVLLEGKLCTIEDRGVVTAMDPKTGDVIWQKRLGGDFSSSPVVANRRLYCFDEHGKGHVLDADGNILAENTLDAGCLASPAVIGSDLLVRTRTSLYCLREKPAP
jgi:outer membrane protein assembly factor BamB